MNVIHLLFYKIHRTSDLWGFNSNQINPSTIGTLSVLYQVQVQTCSGSGCIPSPTTLIVSNVIINVTYTPFGITTLQQTTLQQQTTQPQTTSQEQTTSQDTTQQQLLEQTNSNSNSTIGAIIGGVVGGVVGFCILILLILLLLYVLRRKKTKQQENTHTELQSTKEYAEIEDTSQLETNYSPLAHKPCKNSGDFCILL